MGRSALDQEAIQLIESLNPGIEFDWTRILKGEGAEEKRPVGERRGQDALRERGPRSRTRREAGATPQRAEVAAHPAAPTGIPEEPPGPPSTAEAAGTAADEAAAAAVPPGDLTAPPVTAAHARLGGEGVSRMRARYGEILARIAERVPDPARREELNALAERLNPDGWVTGDEVVRGLEAYENVLADVRAAVGPRRRRRRRRSRQPESGAEAGTGPAAAGGPAGHEAASAVEDEVDGNDFDEDGS